MGDRTKDAPAAGLDTTLELASLHLRKPGPAFFDLDWYVFVNESHERLTELI